MAEKAHYGLFDGTEQQYLSSYVVAAPDFIPQERQGLPSARESWARLNPIDDDARALGRFAMRAGRGMVDMFRSGSRRVAAAVQANVQRGVEAATVAHARVAGAVGQVAAFSVAYTRATLYKPQHSARTRPHGLTVSTLSAQAQTAPAPTVEFPQPDYFGNQAFNALNAPTTEVPVIQDRAPAPDFAEASTVVFGAIERH